uniref:Nuclear pore complex protein Nup214 n=1 Tax=Scleropages formosus TaxID=113540 RepID=A0A8C9TJ98_SCLFO
MSDDPDPIPERDMKDFQFRQMKKIRVFDAPDDLPRERCSLLAVSNKFGLTFAGQERTLKMFHTKDVLLANKAEGNPNEIVEGVKALEVTVECPLHHLALSSDELTLSVCGVSEEGGLLLTFFDVRTFLNKARPEKLPFGSLRPAVDPGTLVQDLKWNPAQTSVLAVCLSDGSMMVLEVTDSVTVQAQLPASVGITCVCWSPKGKQVAAGKQNATVIQYTPALQEKKVIPCPHFYTSDNPVKVLDVLWLSTYVFAVVYAAADGSPETPPDLVVVSLPKKDDKKGERYLNFSDLVYGTCTERQHHYFLSHIEDWDLVLAASAASIEVSIIAKQEDKTSWELWLLEDASRAELPVTMNNDDTLPVGVAIDYTSQEEIRISDECVLPPAPTLMLLSTDGVLCPFSLLNQNPGVKQLSTAPVSLALEGERIPAPGQFTGSASMAPALCATAAPAATVAPTFASTLPTSAVGQLAPAATPSGFSFSLPSSLSAAPSMFSSTTPAAAAVQSTVSTGFLSAAQTIKMDLPAAPAFSFSATSIKPPVETSGAPPSSAQRPSTASPITSFKTPVEPATPAVKVNLNDRWHTAHDFLHFQIAHFQKELDDLKARSDKADFTVGTVEEMKELRKESEDLHVFTIEIKETTESLHGDISTLKTTLLEGFAGAEEGKAQSELNKDRGYLQLLYKKPLDPRSEEQLKEIRRLYQYVKFAMEDVNDVLDLEWEKHLEKKKKHKHLIVPEREALFTTLANHLDIINQQKQKLDSLVKDLQALRLYNRPAAWSIPSHRPATPQSMDSELEVLRDTLMKASLETPPKAPSITPAKMSPVKQSQLRNFLCKRQTPPIRSTAPANLSRSAFLSPKYYEDLDDASSTSSLSQPLDPEDSHSLEEEESALAPSPGHAIVVPRHPTVVRTPSIQPGFRMQTAPFSKLPSGLSTAASPGTHLNVSVPPSKINMGGADSTAFATKTVKHGAPPAEKTTPVTIPAQQAAATAALRRQMASQKPGSWSKFSFNSTNATAGKLVFGGGTDTSFSFTPKPSSAALGGTNSTTPPASVSAEPARPVSSTPPMKMDFPASKPVGAGETLGSFSGLRVGQGDEETKELPKTTTSAASGFSFSTALGATATGVASFSFGSGFRLGKTTEPAASEAEPTTSTTTTTTGGNLPKATASIFESILTPSAVSAEGVFKPSDPTAPVTTKSAFSVAQPAAVTSASISFSSLLAAPLTSPNPEPPASLSETTTVADTPQPPASDVESTAPVTFPLLSSDGAATTLASPQTIVADTATGPEKPPTPPSPAPSPVPAVAPTTVSVVLPTPSAEGTPLPECSKAPETTATSTCNSTAAAVATTSQQTSLFGQMLASDKPPESIFTQPAVSTDSTTLGVSNLTSVISTAAPLTTPTPAPAVAAAAAAPAACAPAPSGGLVFCQPAAPTTNAPPAPAPAASGFGSTGFGSGVGATGFGKPVFGQVGGFGQPAASSASSGGFTFGQPAFGSSPAFGQPATAVPASSSGGVLFGSSSSSSSASSFSFGQMTTSSATTAGSSGLFGQSSTPAFGQQSSGFGQGSLFGAATTTAATGFSFGQPSGELLPPNLHAVTHVLSPSHAGSSSLFGNSGAKTFGFGSSSFGEQKPAGTFSAGGGSVAAQGFGSFTSPAKPGGFGSAPVFGSPPAFGGSPSFGGTSAFGSGGSFSNPLGSTPSKVFGEGTAAANVGGFGSVSSSVSHLGE